METEADVATAQPAQEPMLPQPFIVRRLQRETEDTFTLDLAPLSGNSLAFRPGQFNMLYVFGIGEVLAQAVVRLGASAGLLGGGAASSAATLGSGLIVGLVLDRVLAWLWDGRGELIRELEARIAAWAEK